MFIPLLRETQNMAIFVIGLCHLVLQALQSEQPKGLCPAIGLDVGDT